jgi:hypothetical protein
MATDENTQDGSTYVVWGVSWHVRLAVFEVVYHLRMALKGRVGAAM